MNYAFQRSHNQASVLADDPRAGSAIRPKAIRPTERQRRLIQWVADCYGIPAAWIRQRDNTKMTVAARHMVMFLLVECGGLSTTAVGRVLGGFHHTTVLHGLEKMRAAKDVERRMKFLDGADAILGAKMTAAGAVIPEPKEVQAA